MPRPSQPILSAGIITDAALRAVDSTGDFTMPGIAAKLSVRPSSLYNHVSGRAEIIELMRSRAMAEITVASEEDENWSDTVARLAREYRRSYAKHPRLIPILTSQTVRTGVAFAMYNALAQAFSDGGFAPAQVLAAITTLDSFVLGSALDLAAPEEVWADVPDANDAMRAALATSTPNPERADAAFEFGLRTLVAGWLAQSCEAG
ncbi:TetR/AcrR family transcriptional regulator C-terminal domain-containing protein [Antrihabitans sp. YC3-6]|uniref:TetR/AcrR family transcriptional regulator C-terminal domain-containing protein n=1 Tax=Antrihabitans stalagmiti TaxID=2799499 RepID=A0A934U1N6_9NOCA|nr:TetR/AcrR family transcriptional regulator C-terminal domain-containing protein [Antrihabitans stalagmiti]MBJ8338639.1 TetR/AcrR family transcriptional regulator C-terminal domain-containing protein [Antrihabitans stalagmiti]